MEAERGKDVLDRPQKPYKDKDNPPSPVGWRQAERTWPGSSQRRNKMENSDPEEAKDGTRWRTQTQKQPQASKFKDDRMQRLQAACYRRHRAVSASVTTMDLSVCSTPEWAWSWNVALRPQKPYVYYGRTEAQVASISFSGFSTDGTTSPLTVRSCVSVCVCANVCVC